MTNKRLQTDSTLKLNTLTKEQLSDLELLSAYVDGEATQEESHEVQDRLDADLEFKRQYLHMHQIRQGLQAMPTPSSQSHRRLSNQVFRRVRWQKGKVLSLWGGGAIAALFIAGVVSNIPRSNQAEFANRTEPVAPAALQTANESSQDEALVVALNRPVLQIPKLATSEDTP
jgi:anti-sigma factor RsiW